MLIRDDLVKSQRLIDKVLSSYFDIDTRALSNILVSCILDRCKHIFDAHILLLDPYLVTYQRFQVTDRYELRVELDEVWSWVAADIEEYTHSSAKYDIMLYKTNNPSFSLLTCLGSSSYSFDRAHPRLFAILGYAKRNWLPISWLLAPSSFFKHIGVLGRAIFIQRAHTWRFILSLFHC